MLCLKVYLFLQTQQNGDVVFKGFLLLLSQQLEIFHLKAF